MRLLLILALIIASLGFGPPAQAQARPVAAHGHQHSHMAGAGDHRGGHESDHGSGKADHVAHVCPGCAFLGQQAAVAGAPLMPPLPRVSRDPAALDSHETSPAPPPPRSA